MNIDIEALREFLASKNLNVQLIVSGESVELIDNDEGGSIWLL